VAAVSVAEEPLRLPLRKLKYFSFILLLQVLLLQTFSHEVLRLIHKDVAYAV
jgi:hypothetical protein